ncbi:MAG: hypothetical protein KME49_28775 [Brasilonema octagenarum HA4186-MV1]|jgi:hypothetical protein|uniref:Uncharacterized protein n=2 Tax=Brasilonema TaxID=383614 RepID=A0A856MGW3_9CYAN|nr:MULTISPECIES: hypothetical protein [Brasilonema]MBW4629398.1 hypothetical protein [Brasilonema octagenarum HA4186-MV1]NMF66404.1 hypothetical protein [Brasilonema octagenarum UFV-OR1]QDL09938.1 hypothetical protein DP114_20440 [Brasilonema sennae CENA114]QDL16290.1 hypothetical protein DP113_20365 [Brasilonema octagenarum UFV-E1]
MTTATMTAATITLEQKSSSHDLISYFTNTYFDVLNDIKIDDLETIVISEFAQGLPSGTPVPFW